MKSRWYACSFSIFLFLIPLFIEAEAVRVFITGNAEVSPDNPGGVAISLSYTDSALILLGKDIRFFRGLELEFTVPQAYLSHRGSLAIVLYGDLSRIPGYGTSDIDARQIILEPVPNKIRSVYQIPLRTGHGLRTSPYVTVPTGIILPASFPLVFRVMPVIKGLSEEVETMRFTLNVKPILSDEGAVKILLRYPDNFPAKPFIALIDDEVVERPQEERLLREGEHHLVIISDDYRNESRRFIVERGKVLELAVNLQDPTPLLIFESPENALIFLDNQALGSNPAPLAVEPGIHEVRFQVSDYAVIRTLTVQKGKTYRVSLAVNVLVTESESTTLP
ncbi:MAG: PEGA domain-containing protein [Treponema sp.]|jgi:hypothetical protein|nr:PEGA domain-containing protein [Treponema sp.]